MEDITVKCPKCRLTFSTPLPNGVISVDCVCPRCGMPFMHNIKIEIAARSEEKENEIADFSSQRANTETNTKNNTQPTVGDSKNIKQQTSGNIQGATKFLDNIDFEQPSFDTMQKIRQKQRRLIFKLFCAGFVIIILFLFFIIRSCRNSNSSADVVITENEKAMSETSKFITVKGVAHKRNKDAGPDWLQGKWTIDTDFGNITIEITDNRITESSGNKTLSGTFYYTWSKLNCNFGDGKTFVYFLDEDRYLIDAGDGLFMEKIE